MFKMTLAWQTIHYTQSLYQLIAGLRLELQDAFSIDLKSLIFE